MFKLLMNYVFSCRNNSKITDMFQVFVTLFKVKRSESKFIILDITKYVFVNDHQDL